MVKTFAGFGLAEQDYAALNFCPVGKEISNVFLDRITRCARLLAD